MIRVQRGDGVVRVLLDRPDKLNAMTDVMWSELESVLAGATSDPATRAMVISGAGGNFCAGSDVTGLLDDLSSLPDRIRVSNRCVLAVYRAPFPVIAVLDGIAAGSGLNMALACDVVIASERAKLIQVFIRRGLSLDSGGSWLLPRLVGDRLARRLAYSGESVAAAQALEWGLVTDVAAVAELADRVEQTVERLRGSSAMALTGNKKLLAAAWHTSLDEALEAEISNQMAIISTPEVQAAIRSFGS